jgi:lysyl-tRNA synthetase class 2
VAVAGRVIAHRDAGRLVFVVIRDSSDAIQLFCPASAGQDVLDLAKDLILGDIVGASGEVVTTRTGELSVRPEKLVVLRRPARPLPTKWHGISDVETRYRQRYLDFMTNQEARSILQMRGRILQSLRDTLHDRGFIEVETPILQPIPGGATARPFVSHYEALGVDVYLRVAPELYLKRLLVGGFERIFELGRCFRNEGISTRHNPEFTMLEAYQAYTDYRGMMELAKALVEEAAERTLGKKIVEYQGRTIDVGSPWKVAYFPELVASVAGEEIGPSTSLERARTVAKDLGLDIDESWDVGKIAFQIYDKLCEETLFEPTFVVGFPAEVSPLAKRFADEPFYAQRFEAVIAGRELVNAFTELDDPEEQRKRLEEQALRRAAGDAEAMVMDDDFVRALEYGMPPAGGLGLGVDRLVMLLTNQTSIREVLAFPQLKPEKAP